jgi:hypothetical protein
MKFRSEDREIFMSTRKQQQGKSTGQPAMVRAALPGQPATALDALKHTSDDIGNEASPVDASFVLRSDNTPQPRTIKLDQPHWSWIPVRYGPFCYQSTSLPFRSSQMTLQEIDEFVRTGVRDQIIGKCTVDRDDYCFQLSYCDKEADIALSYVFPYEIREKFRSNGGDLRAGSELVVVQIESVWTQMEQRFRSALAKGHCRLLARCGSLTVPHWVVRVEC